MKNENIVLETSRKCIHSFFSYYKTKCKDKEVKIC